MKSPQQGYFQLVTHPSSNPAQQGLTSAIGQDPLLFMWYQKARKSAHKSEVQF